MTNLRPACVCALLAAICHLWSADGSAGTSAELESCFTSPPIAAKPWTFWYWMQNSVTKEAITRDLEAMAGHGIGGVYLFTIGGGKALTDPPVSSLTPLWWEHIDHALREADRLGLQVVLNACDGWATAGSPDITPELSMQEVTSARLVIDGGRPFDGPLPHPPARLDHYRDIAVLAYPEPVPGARTSIELKPDVTTSDPGCEAKSLVAGDAKGLALPQPGWVQYAFAEPFTCRSITVHPARKGYQSMRLEVLVSDDGAMFRSLGRLPVPRHGFADGTAPITSPIPVATGRFFRFICDPAGSEPGAEDLDCAKARSRDGSGMHQIILDEAPSIVDWQGKSGLHWRSSLPTTAVQVPEGIAVPMKAMVDLTGQMAADGRLRWHPPVGRRWVVLRIGHTSNGKRNGPAGAGIGLEPDKFNPAAVRVQFASWFAKAADRQAGLGTHSLVGSHVDSWECHSQNWSPVMLPEFRRRRGYDPTPYLPAMTGVPVESAEVSERFLCDVRQTISELILDHFFDPMVSLVHDRKCSFSAECVAPMMISDGMAHFGRVDVPMGEFWYESSSGDKPNDILDAIHGARLYGKPIVQAEAFTHRDIDWDDSPFEMKAMGDHHFALGINRFVLHVWALKATSGKPGVNLWQYGADYSTGQTWWKPGKAWFDYLARCQAMMQRGVVVADVLYYVGENQPSRSLLPDRLTPALPDGLTYGSINRDALLRMVKADRGRLIFPGGMSYRVLVLPDDERMSPEVAQAIADLSQAGVPVVGRKPNRSISLTDYPRCDDRVRRIVSQGWERVRVLSDLTRVLEDLKILPDLVFPGVDSIPIWRKERQYRSPSLSWGHRRDADADIYFISNQEYQQRSIKAMFRVTGKQPEWWDPATGVMRLLPNWSVQEGRTLLDLEFAQAESCFIVFRHPAEPPRIQAQNLPVFEPFQALGGPWEIDFEPGRGAPPKATLSDLVSFHTSSDEGVRHFSGTATYRHVFSIRDSDVPRVFLDLGRVANLAQVALNGQELGIVWKPPYRLEIPRHVLMKGANILEIAVSTTWRNRMVADHPLPPGNRIAHAPLYRWGVMKDRPLVESGLLGPVMLQRMADRPPMGRTNATP